MRSTTVNRMGIVLLLSFSPTRTGSTMVPSGTTWFPPNPIKGLSRGCKCFSSNCIFLRQSIVRRSAVLPVSTSTLLTFICPIFKVTTRGSVCGCCSIWEVVASNFMTGPLDVVIGGPFSKVWTLSFAARMVGYSSVYPPKIRLIVP